jgi:hypothetical protein
MSTIGNVTSGATQAMMMKPPSGPPQGPLRGAQPVPDGDGDTDGSLSVPSGHSSERLLDLSA